MSPKQDGSQNRKDQIIDAAFRVFARLGFNKARMDDIVDESGISKGGVYWYFKSKDEIIMAVLDRMIDRELAEVIKASETNMSAYDQLNLMVDLVEKDFRQINFLMPILYEFYALGMRNATVRKMLAASMQKFLDVFIPVIEKGIRDHEFRQVNPFDAAVAIGGLIEGTILLKGYNPELIDLSAHIRSGMQILLNGLVNPAGDMQIQQGKG